jgi:hypothetical protein
LRPFTFPKEVGRREGYMILWVFQLFVFLGQDILFYRQS